MESPFRLFWSHRANFYFWKSVFITLKCVQCINAYNIFSNCSSIMALHCRHPLIINFHHTCTHSGQSAFAATFMTISKLWWTKRLVKQIFTKTDEKRKKKSVSLNGFCPNRFIKNIKTEFLADIDSNFFYHIFHSQCTHIKSFQNSLCQRHTQKTYAGKYKCCRFFVCIYLKKKWRIHLEMFFFSFVNGR